MVGTQVEATDHYQHRIIPGTIVCIIEVGHEVCYGVLFGPDNEKSVVAVPKFDIRVLQTDGGKRRLCRTHSGFRLSNQVEKWNPKTAAWDRAKIIKILPSGEFKVKDE